MKKLHKFISVFFAVIMIFTLASCGEGADDVQPDGEQNETAVTDMTALDGMWSVNDVTKLYFNSADGYYLYQSYFGPGGKGAFYEVDGKPMISFNGFLYDFLMRDDGVLILNQNGEGADELLSLHRNTFTRDDSAAIVERLSTDYDGMWQNSVGETILIDSSIGQYIACSSDYSINGTLNDDNDGMGLSMYDNGKRSYIRLSDDGNSFTVSGDTPGRNYDDGKLDGVFYKDGRIDAYADMSKAKFYYGKGLETWLWYFDGANDYFLGDDYETSEGRAYCIKDNKVYPGGWIPEQIYDPAEDWGEDWMNNWTV